MELRKLAPWNWFKKEEEMDRSVPVSHAQETAYPERRYDPMLQLHRDLDHLFDRFFQGFPGSMLSNRPTFSSLEESAILRPKVDLSASEQEYLLTVEIPGVSEKDVSLNISGDTMTIKGEKKQEKEHKEKDYYRLERSYGSFQRVLSLPEDVDQQAIKASFKDGVLTVTMPRTSLPKREVQQIPITGEK